MLRFDQDPDRETTPPKDAATVIVVREDDDCIRLFCVKRHQSSGFLGGALVFPGGKLAAADLDPEWEARSTPLGERARLLGTDERVARGYAVAALRELLEEAAILPTVGPSLGPEALESLRRELGSRAQEPRAFQSLLAERELVLDVARLEALWRWVTPRAEQRRFDTRFYVLSAPPGQSGRHDDHETTHSFWASPTELLQVWERGEAFLAPPTLRAIQLFERARSVEEALGLARVQPLEPVCPEFMMVGESAVLALPGDALFSEPRAAPSDPDAPTRFVLEDGRFIPRRVPRPAQ